MSTYSPQFLLNFATGSIRFPLSPAGCQELRGVLESLTERLRITAGGSPTHQQSPVDHRRQEEGLVLEVFCNPNIWPSPHAAKVLVTLKASGLRFSSEVELPRLLEDLSQFLEAS
ncbi:MAG: hypothetical protein NW237_12990 [Cyanobacteriota bacterium]|nr:hypothetical protein [Cyanobacteriota bacterium]